MEKMDEPQNGVSFVTADDILPLRSRVLRNGMPEQDCRFVTDIMDGSFHLGFYEEGNLVSISSWHRQKKEGYEGEGFQLRGMATEPEYRGKGFGAKVANFGLTFLRGKNVDYVWCNARKVAWPFYSALGFEFISDEFEIEGIGPHKVMYLRIK